MKNLLALHFNIRTVHFLDSSNVDRYYAFSSKMLAKNIFIEYFSSDTLESAGNEETQNEQVEDDPEAPEYGSQLSVVMKHKNKYYQFLMFHNTVEIGIPVMLLQTIIFLVKLIEEIEPGRLIDHLAAIATDPLIPDEIPDIEHREIANKMLRLKFQTVHDLIQEDNSDRN